MASVVQAWKKVVTWFGVSSSTSSIPAAPVKLTNPSISGGAVVGLTLTATHGTYSGSITGYQGQWYSAGLAIALATSLTYTVQSSDIGHNITYSELAYNAGGGSALGLSNSLGPVTASGGTAGQPIGGLLLTLTKAS